MESVTIEEILRLCRADLIRWTGHVAERMVKRQIAPSEMKGRPIHVVCSIGNDELYIITAYQPDTARWDATFRIRRKGDDLS